MSTVRRATGRLVAVILLATMALSAGAYAQSRTPGTAPPPPLAIAHGDGEIILDGQLNEPVWQRATVIEIPLKLYETPRSSEDLSAVARVFWNDAGLYVAATVTDDTLLFPPNTRHMAEWDSFEVWVNHLWIQVSPSAEGDDMLLRYRYLKGFPARSFETQAAVSRHETGYTAEVFIPAATVAAATESRFERGATLPFAVGVTERDDPDQRGRAVLTFPARFGWNSPESMAAATLE